MMPSPTMPRRILCMHAVAQKSPCERNRVIMGQISPLKLGQRGPDTRQEVPMRTPKQLYAHERSIYQPEFLTNAETSMRLCLISLQDGSLRSQPSSAQYPTRGTSTTAGSPWARLRRWML